MAFQPRASPRAWQRLRSPASDQGRGAAPANLVRLPSGAVSPSSRRRASLDIEAAALPLTRSEGLGWRRSWRRASFYRRAIWAWQDVCLFPEDSGEDMPSPAASSYMSPMFQAQDEIIEEAGISFKEDVYDAVLAAAFGGVRMQLDGPGVTRVHPFFIFLLCFPLVCVQFALTFCVGLSMNFSAEVVPHDSPTGGMVVSIKMVLVIILQMFFFNRLLSNVRLFLFTLNPASWTDVRRPVREGARNSWVYRTPVMAMSTIGALSLKFVMQYYVNIVSASIVLASGGIKGAIFDSLAISFIVDLDMTMWAFVKTILHLDDIGDFSLRLWPKAVRRHMTHGWPGPWRSLLRVRFLHRGHGARRFENFVSFGLMFAVYFRVAMIVLYALMTNKVPAARDVCLQWRWLKGHPRRRWLSAWFFRVTVHTLLFPFSHWWTPEAQVSEAAKKFCNNTYAETSSDHWSEIVATYPCATLLTCFFLFALLLVPEIFLERGSTLQSFIRAFHTPAVDEESDDSAASQVRHHDFAEQSGRCIAMKVADLDKHVHRDMSDLREQVRALRSRLDLHGLR